MADAQQFRARELPTMADFVVGVVRVAFLVRLGALSLVLLMPVSELKQGRVIVAVVVIAATSIAGFYRHQTVVDLVRRHPLAAAIDVLLAAGVAALIGADSPLIFYTLSTALLVGVLSSPLNTALLTFILAGSQLVAVVESTPDSREDLFYLFVMPATCVVIVLLGSVTRILHEQVIAQQDEAARLRADAVKLQERTRLARDMHDSVAKSLHGIGLAAAALPAWLDRDPHSGRERALQIKEAAETAASQAREMLSGLRDDVADRPLREVIVERITEFRAESGLAVQADCGGVVDVRASVKQELLRTVAEALENVARHAEASAVQVTCRADGPDLVVEIVDDGRGFDVAAGKARAGHYGLQGMEERVRAVGGALSVNSAPGSGTTVRIELPACEPTVDVGVKETAQ